MFSGGQVVNRTLSDAQSLMCGEAFDPIQTPDNTCLSVVEDLYTSNTPPQNQDIYDQWVMLATARIYSDCAFKAAGDIATSTTCVRQAVGSGTSPAHIQLFESISSPTAPLADKPIYFMDEFYSYADFFKKANELSAAGVGIDVYDIPLDIPVPESVMNAIRDLTGDMPLLNTEMVRVYRELMRSRPPMEQVNPAIQEAVGLNMVDDFKQAKTKGTEDTADDMPLNEFYRYAVMSYGDVAFDDHSVVVEQIPDSLPADLNITDVPAIGEVRRLFVEVENAIKDNPQVAAHLATLDAAARETYMASIRAQIVDKIKPAIAEKIEGLAPDKIKQELQRYYAVVEFEVASDNTVNIIMIELKEKAQEGTGLIPPALIDGLDARSSIVRFAAVARIWASVVRLAPDAENPGELQDGLVASLVGQLHDATNEEMLRTIVLSVDQQNRTVTLGEAPEGILSEETPAWGHAEIAGSSVTIFEHHIQENPGLSDTEQVELAGEIRDAVEAFEELHAGEQTLDADITRNADGTFNVEIFRIGGGTGDDPTVNDGWYGDGELVGMVQYGSQGLAGEASASTEVGYAWENFKLYVGFGVLGYGAGEYLTNSDAASFQMAEGESNAFRLNEAFLGGTILYDNGQVKIRAGHMGVRYGSDNPAVSYYHNMQFSLLQTPDIDTSRLVGGSVDWTHQFPNVELVFGVKGGMGSRVSLWQESGDQVGLTSGVFGGHAGVNVMLHEESETQLNLQAIGYYPLAAIIEGGISTHPHENVIIAVDGRYAYLQTNDNPDSEHLGSISLFGYFPIQGASATWIPYIGASYGGRQGAAHWGGSVVDGGCTHIGIDCGDNLLDVGFRGFSGDAGLEIRPLAENSPVQLQIILGGNLAYGTSLTSGADAGLGGAFNGTFILTF